MDKLQLRGLAQQLAKAARGGDHGANTSTAGAQLPGGGDHGANITMAGVQLSGGGITGQHCHERGSAFRTGDHGPTLP